MNGSTLTLQEGEVFARWRMQDQFLHQSKRCCQIRQFEYLYGGVRITARELDFKRSNAPAAR